MVAGGSSAKLAGGSKRARRDSSSLEQSKCWKLNPGEGGVAHCNDPPPYREGGEDRTGRRDDDGRPPGGSGTLHVERIGRVFPSRG